MHPLYPFAGSRSRAAVANSLAATLDCDQQRKGGKRIGRMNFDNGAAVSIFQQPGGLLAGVGHSGGSVLGQDTIAEAVKCMTALAAERNSTSAQLVLLDASSGTQRLLEGQAASLLCQTDAMLEGCATATLVVAAYSPALVAAPHTFTRQLPLQGPAEERSGAEVPAVGGERAPFVVHECRLGWVGCGCAGQL